MSAFQGNSSWLALGVAALAASTAAMAKRGSRAVEFGPPLSEPFLAYTVGRDVEQIARGTYIGGRDRPNYFGRSPIFPTYQVAHEVAEQDRSIGGDEFPFILLVQPSALVASRLIVSNEAWDAPSRYYFSDQQEKFNKAYADIDPIPMSVMVSVAFAPPQMAPRWGSPIYMGTQSLEETHNILHHLWRQAGAGAKTVLRVTEQIYILRVLSIIDPVNLFGEGGNIFFRRHGKQLSEEKAFRRRSALGGRSPWYLGPHRLTSDQLQIVGLQP
jgi:hypothetical protein